MVAKLLAHKNAKTVISIIVVIIILIIVYRYYKKNIAKKEASQLTKAAENEIISNAKTFTDSDYQSMADALYGAMEGAATDEETILQIISNLRTKSDWLSVVSKFGVKEKGIWPANEPMNLVQWLANEHSGSDKARLNFSLNRFGVVI